MDESDMMTKGHFNAHMFRLPWSEYQLPPMHRACKDGDLQSLIYLVTQGDRTAVFHNINEQDCCLLWTPAHWASYFGKLDCLKKLLSSGLDIDLVDGKFSQTPAQLAAFGGHTDVLLWLLQCGASTDRVDCLGENVVHKAVRGGSVDCLSLLQAYGAPIEAINNKNQTPFDVAASLGLEDCCLLLRSFIIPSGSKQKSLKRCLDDHMEWNKIKRQRNGKVQYNGYVEMISAGQDGLHQQNSYSEKLLNGFHQIPQSHFVNGDSQAHHNGFNGVNNLSDMQSISHSHNACDSLSDDTDMIDSEQMDKLESECNNNNVQTLVNDVDENIRKDYLHHPHFRHRSRCYLYGHLA